MATSINLVGGIGKSTAEVLAQHGFITGRRPRQVLGSGDLEGSRLRTCSLNQGSVGSTRLDGIRSDQDRQNSPSAEKAASSSTKKTQRQPHLPSREPLPRFNQRSLVQHQQPALLGPSPPSQKALARNRRPSKSPARRLNRRRLKPRGRSPNPSRKNRRQRARRRQRRRQKRRPRLGSSRRQKRRARARARARRNS